CAPRSTGPPGAARGAGRSGRPWPSRTGPRSPTPDADSGRRRSRRLPPRGERARHGRSSAADLRVRFGLGQPGACDTVPDGDHRLLEELNLIAGTLAVRVHQLALRGDREPGAIVHETVEITR